MAVTFLFLLASWLYIGIAKDNFYEESYNVFFIKKYPSLQIFFINSTLTEADTPSLNEWEINDISELKDYCHYRFGINDYTKNSLSECAKRPHRSKSWLTEWHVGT